MSTSSVGLCLRGCVFASVVLASACSSSPKGSGESAGGGGAGAFGGNDGGAGTSGVASQTVGTQGGTVTLDDVTLMIPGDALAADTVITVSMTTAPAGYIIASAAYQLAPADTTFAHAVSVTLLRTTAALGAHLFLSDGNGGFEDRGGIVSGPLITAQITHFGTCFAALPSSDGGAPDLAADVAGAKDGGDAASGTDANGKDGAGAAGSGAAGAGTAGAGAAGSGAAGAAGSGAAGAGTAGSGSAGSGTAGAGTAGAGAAGSGGQTDAGQSSDTGGASDAGASPDSGDGGTDATSSPLCDATGINAPAVTVTTITDGTPVPAGSTYMGGTISSGTYYLTSVTHYGTDYTGPQKSVRTFDATAQTLRAVDSPFLQGTVLYTGFNLSNPDAHTLQGSVICSTAQVSTTTWYYTISGSTLTMSQVGSNDVAVYSAGL
jgi:hypothetical protein